MGLFNRRPADAPADAPSASLKTATFPVPEQPHHWVNSEGLGLRLQCFLVVRDRDRRVACVRLKANPQVWSLPGETLKPNEDLLAAAERVSHAWFGHGLDLHFAGVQNYPDTGDGKWYVLFLFEGDAPKEGFKLPDDTAEIAFAPVGKPPGPFGMDHGTVFGRLRL